MGRKIGKILVVLGMIFCLNGLRSRAEEATERYQILCDEPNGENGYYIEAVDIEIKHFDKTSVTKFQMNFPDGKELTGTLNDTSNQVVLEAGLFAEGVHNLVVWMEDEDGNKIEGTEEKKEIKIDRVSPEQFIQFQYPENHEETELFFSKEIQVGAGTTDLISGVRGIYYQLGEDEYRFAEGENIKVTIPIGFEGKIAAYAVDFAGNKSEVSYSKEIICENQAPEIEIQAPKGFENWYNQTFLIDFYIKENEIYSGMKKIVCSVNDTIVLERNYEKKDVVSEHLSISIGTASEIVVEATDWAGNYSRKREKVLFDNENPEINMEGMEDFMISAGDREITCKVTDNQRVVSVDGTIVCTNVLGEITEKRIENWNKEEEHYSMSEMLKESGKYEINVEATDQAGNRVVRQMKMILDKENPVIHKVNELNGKHMRFFEWNYDTSEVIDDFTTYTYQINLDGKICEKNIRYTNEGSHFLEVIAEDSAGNQSLERAEFIIDHTSPEIVIQNSDDFKELNIRLKEESDLLEAVFINGEKQNINTNSNEFMYTFDDSGKKEIYVAAVDLAGNKTEEKSEFEIKEEKSLLQKFINHDKKENDKVSHQEKKSEGKVNMLAGILLVCMGILIVGVCYKKLSHKREDAG